MSEAKPNPYSDLPKNAFWKSAVSSQNPFEISGLWNPKFQIRQGQWVSTFGSCFAQHIGRALRARGFNWLLSERAPPGLSVKNRMAFNYDLFTCRTGNIYTASLLNQWVTWALDEKTVPDEYWVSNGRYFDPFRPRVEPDGFESLEEMRASRSFTIEAFRRAITNSQIFVFTLGLTESWFNKSKGYEYPMCPGTAAGTFDPAEHVFRNQNFDFIRANLIQAIGKIRSVNPNIRFILTVSPVPLTATYSNQHVLVATMESKSILRAVAAQISRGRPRIDYFPSYEIVNSAVFGGRFFEPNQRAVSGFGVDFVMNSFFAAQAAKFGPIQPPALQRLNGGGETVVTGETAEKAADEVCEEKLLEAFGER